MRFSSVKSAALLLAFSLSIPEISLVSSEVADAQESAYPSGMSERSIRQASRARRVQNRALADVCRTTKPLTKALLKNAWPGHIQQSDPRASGFAFVCGPDCPRKFPVSAYYSDGELAFKLGYYGTWEGNGRPRAYCGAGGVGRCSATAITRSSKRGGRDGKVYLNFGSGSCRSAIPGRRNGSPF